jgi:hypothetical protein
MKNVSSPSAEYGDRPPEMARAGLGTAQRSARWPRWARRGPMEMVASVIIALGFLMMLQPFALVLFTWSFVTTLAGVVLFTIVSKFPQ